MTDVFLAEILGQPEALERAGAAIGRQVDGLHALARHAPREGIVLTGMGASYDACLAMASVLGSRGVLATAVNTAELVHFRLPAVDASALVVAVSQSGRSAELVRLADELSGPLLVSVTNGLDNQLADAADVAFDTEAGIELGPSTMTFAASLPPLAAVAAVLAGDQPAAAAQASATAADAAAVHAARMLGTHEELAARMLGWLGDRAGALLVGRGTARAAADLGSLVLKEAAGLAAECLDAAEFRHGPLELAGPDLAVAVVAEPATSGLDRALASEVAALGGAAIVLSPLGDEPGEIAVGDLHRLVAPAVAAIPFELLAWQLARRRGRRPGEFTVATKVTTRE
jgi:glucosamine--fructose-6-phosphate aminotransferase (isomerizing)